MAPKRNNMQSAPKKSKTEYAAKVSSIKRPAAACEEVAMKRTKSTKTHMLSTAGAHGDYFFERLRALEEKDHLRTVALAEAEKELAILQERERALAERAKVAEVAVKEQSAKVEEATGRAAFAEARAESIQENAGKIDSMMHRIVSSVGVMAPLQSVKLEILDGPPSAVKAMSTDAPKTPKHGIQAASASDTPDWLREASKAGLTSKHMSEGSAMSSQKAPVKSDGHCLDFSTPNHPASKNMIRRAFSALIGTPESA